MDYNIWQDIDDAIDVALAERLHLQSQSALVARSDALLASLPQMRNRRTTTAELLRRYHVELQQELCQDHRPRMRFSTLEDEVRELTRGVAATIVSDSGISIENAVVLALVLRAQGLEKFCALSAPPSVQTY